MRMREREREREQERRKEKAAATPHFASYVLPPFKPFFNSPLWYMVMPQYVPAGICRISLGDTQNRSIHSTLLWIWPICWVGAAWCKVSVVYTAPKGVLGYSLMEGISLGLRGSCDCKWFVRSFHLCFGFCSWGVHGAKISLATH